MKHQAKLTSSEHTMSLPDGRTLCWNEYGEPDGVPILALHGNPGSRLMWGLLPDTRSWQGIRLIAPDRPGFGRSTSGPGLIEWTEDLRGLLDHLALERIDVLAISGGGPGGLAAAWRLPERIRRLVLVSPVGPLAPGVTDGMNSNRYLFALGRWAPWLVRLQMDLVAHQMRESAERAIALLHRKLPPIDRELLNREGIREALQADWREACRQGGSAMAAESLYPGNWPIPLEQITTPVTVWQGDADRSVGQMGKWSAEHVARGRFVGLPGQGHLWLLAHIREPVDALLETHRTKERPSS